MAAVYRYIREAAQALAPLAEAMQTIRAGAFVTLDGTLPPIDYIAADTLICFGKHKRPGMNAKDLTNPVGRPLWPRRPCPARLTT
ncbi:hypothetical protein [Streptomyces omiyaensis]|uniref:hypothetical protein n=1 Tax=Streptomyces omiyaensis TaxID=68247 RepID=UPI0036F4B968